MPSPLWPLIEVAFAAHAMVTDPPPSALRSQQRTVTAYLRSDGGSAVAEPGGGAAGSVLWHAQDGGISLFLAHPGFHTRP
jgi:hypothetical protein